MADKLQIGVMSTLTANVNEVLGKVKQLNLTNCQLACWAPEMYTPRIASDTKQACKEHGVEVSSLWAGYPGDAVWDFIKGPSTIGFVPPETRDLRVETLLKAAEFAAEIGTPSLTTHAGFIPENPGDPLYPGTVEALTKIAERCKELGLYFCFETGQETPITLLRVMTDIGTDNLGVNLDPANLLMYGKANPIDALDIIGTLIRGVHAKDGEYPTEPNRLGVEKPLGEGRVDFPRLVAKLKALGYAGPLTIEREISGEKQIVDIKKAIELLAPLC